jgi:PAS domain S-box-containing protein
VRANEFLEIADLWPDPVLLIAADGTVMGGNRKVERVLGRSRAELEGLAAVQLGRWRVVAGGRGSIEDYLAGCGRTRDFVGAEIEVSRGGRSHRWRTEGAMLGAATDEAPALVLLRFLSDDELGEDASDKPDDERLALDTSHIGAAERLRNSEQRFRQFAEQITDVFWLADVESGRLVYVSPAFEQLWGRPPDGLEVRGTGYLSAIHPNDRAEVERSFRAQARGEQTGVEYRVLRPDGTMRWVFDRGFPIRDESGGILRVCGVAVDITARKHMEESLAERTHRLGLLRNVAAHLLTAREPGPMVQGLFDIFRGTFGLDTCFSFLAPETADGLRLESWVGVSDEFAKSIERIELGRGVSGRVALQRRPMVLGRIDELREPYSRALMRAGIRAYACFPLLLNHRLFGTLSFGSRSRDQFDDGDIAFFQTIADYVTAAYDRLELVRELKEADRRKDLFLATLAHELRNPLAPIRSGLELLPLTHNDPEMAQQVYDAMERQLRQMSRLLDDLLDVSRITRDKLALKKTPVELGAVVQSAVEISRPAIDAAGHTLTVTLPAEPVPIEADPVRLAQVFSNLLNNAAKYTSQGGHIWLTATIDAEEITVRVRDDGVGIAPELLPRVFEPFVQGGPGSPGQGGLGIGLMLARRLIELHGGGITAASGGPGQGAEFTVTLPRQHVSRAKRSTARGGDQAATGTSQGVRVLVVDDNQDYATITARLLCRLGHEVQTAVDGPAALEVARKFRPQAAFIDIGLPGISGLELARLLRERPESRDALLIAVSGFGQADDVEASIAAGFERHLVKPVEPQEYRRILSRFCSPGAAPARGS